MCKYFSFCNHGYPNLLEHSTNKSRPPGKSKHTHGWVPLELAGLIMWPLPYYCRAHDIEPTTWGIWFVNTEEYLCWSACLSIYKYVTIYACFATEQATCNSDHFSSIIVLDTLISFPLLMFVVIKHFIVLLSVKLIWHTK